LLKTFSQRRVAKKIGVTTATLSRLLRKAAHLADHELSVGNARGELDKIRPRQFLRATRHAHGCATKLQSLYLLTIGASSDYMGKNRRTGSMALTLERFADDALCPPELAPILHAGKQPAPLVKIIRAITADIEQKYRGARHAELNGTLIQRRELIEILSDGSRVEIQLGDWWVFDDMSTNHPFWFAGPDETPMVARQGLYAYDVCRRWLGCELIGTSRDAYTAAIILRYFRRLMQALGKPRRGVVLERSVWAARSIKGFRTTSSGRYIEDEFDRAAMDDDEKNLINSGLKALGIEGVLHAHAARQRNRRRV